MNKMTRRVGTGIAAGFLALGLVACSDANETAQNATDAASDAATQATSAAQEAATEATSAAADATSAAQDAVSDATSSNNAQGQQAAQAPCELTSISTHAQADMAEDNLTEADINDALQRACNGEGRVEREIDNGVEYFEIDLNDIDVDITPEGEVLEADR